MRGETITMKYKLQIVLQVHNESTFNWPQAQTSIEKEGTRAPARTHTQVLMARHLAQTQPLLSPLQAVCWLQQNGEIDLTKSRNVHV